VRSLSKNGRSARSHYRLVSGVKVKWSKGKVAVDGRNYPRREKNRRGKQRQAASSLGTGKRRRMCLTHHRLRTNRDGERKKKKTLEFARQ